MCRIEESELNPNDELQNGLIKICVIKKDNKMENLRIIANLKSVYQMQLPKMPKEYIVRYVFDSSHENFIMLKAEKIVGGVTYRRFDENQFVEIVFCAISSSYQVRGYGSFLLANLKEYLKKNYKTKYALTYADNYALGFFQKQGFSTEITFPVSKWGGKIKDYDGGTLVECEISYKFNYLEFNDHLNKQIIRLEEIIKQKIPFCYIEYPPILEDINGDIEKIPGLQNLKKIPYVKFIPKSNKSDAFYNILSSILLSLQNHPMAWPFLEPVSKDDVPDYHLIIKNPMDFSTIEGKINEKKYVSCPEFVKDINLIFSNCRLYNSEKTPYYKCANILEAFFSKKLKEKGFENLEPS